MKPRSRFLFSSAFIVVATSVTPLMAANTDYYWDTNGATSGIGGASGAWDTTTTNWSTASAGNIATVAYPNGSGATTSAHLGGTAGTITIAANTTINVNSLIFDGGATGNYTLAGTNSTSILNFTGTAPTIVNTFGGIETISAKITGTSGFALTGGNFTVLSGDLSGLTGTVSVGGRINLNGATVTGTQNQIWDIASGQNLTSNNKGTGSTIQLGGLSGSGTLRTGNDNTVGVGGTDTFQIGALNTDTTFSGSITNFTSGLGGTALAAITKVGTAKLTLSGTNNSYTGATTINQGTLSVASLANGGSNSSIGAATNAAGNLVLGGGTLQYTGATVSTDRSFTLTTGTSSTIDVNSSGTNLTISGSSANTTGVLVKAGAGTLTLSSANSHTGGTTINAGTLAIGNNGSLGTGTATISEGATLANNSASALTLTNAFSLSGATTGATFTGSQNLTLNGGISYTAGMKVNKTGASVLTISSDNSGSAANVTWNVSGGTYNSSTGLYSSVIALNSGRALGNATGNVLNLNGGTLRFTTDGGSGYASSRSINVQSGGGSIDDGGFAFGEATAGQGAVAPTISIANGATLSLVSSNKLVLSGVASGSGGAVAKFGTGTLTLSGSNTYTGATTLNAGTTVFSGSGSLYTNGTVAGTVNVNNGATLRFDRQDTFGNHTSASAVSVNVNSGGTVSGNGFFNTLNNLNLNGGTLQTANGDTTYGSFALKGTVTVGGSAASTISSTGSTGNVIAIGTNAAGGATTFAVADVTGSSATDLTISAVMKNNRDASAEVASGLTKTGAGTLTLSGSNLYTGGTTITGGTVAIGNSNALSSGAVTINDGATLANNAAPVTLANNFTLSGTTTGATFTGSQNLTVNGSISSAAAVTVNKTGASVLTLSADNSGTLAANSVWNVTGGTYNSSTGLYDNVIAVNMGQNLGNSSGNVLNLNGGTLRFNANGGAGYSPARTINVLSGGGSIDDGGFAYGEATSGGGVVAPNISIANSATLSLVSSNKLVLSGVLSGNGGVTKFGTGTATLSGTSTYTGATVINNGVLATNNLQANGTASGIGQGTALTISGGGTLRYTGASGGFNRAITVGTGGGTMDNAGSGALFVDGSITGSGALSFVDSSNSSREFLVTGNSSGFSGNISIGTATAGSGLLQYRSNASNPFGTGSITINAGGVLTADAGTTSPSTLGNNIVLNGGLLGTQGTAMTYTGTVNLAASSTVGKVPAYGTSAITLSNVISGGSSAALNVATTSTVTISNNSNTYTGATNVNSGKLVVNGNISTSVLTTVKTGGTLGGSGTVGAVTVQSGGTIAPGNSPGILNTGNLSLESDATMGIEIAGDTIGTQYDQLNVGGTVSLAGLLSLTTSYAPANDTLFFILANDSTDAIAGTFSNATDTTGTTIYTFGGTQQYLISYVGNYTGGGTGTFTGGNDVVLMAVPEPNIAALLGGMASVLLLRRKRDVRGS